MALKMRWFRQHKIRAARFWFFGIGGVQARQAGVRNSNYLIRMAGYSHAFGM